jgi:hypothetical protein
MTALQNRRAGAFSSLFVTLLCLFFLSAASACGTDVGNGTGDTSGDQPGDWTGESPLDVPPGDVLADVPWDVSPDGPVDDCDERAKWIYIVDSDDTLIRFKPDDLSLTVIGILNCPAPALYSPFSMSVDRNATAWVLYANLLLGMGGGQLFKVSTLDASCVGTDYVPAQESMEVFGMGFVSDVPGGTEETLFVAGGLQSQIADGPASLAVIDTASLVVTRVGQVPQWPELTGTGLAELWGFFPESTPPTVQMIDKTTGSVSNTYNLAPLDTGQTEAWAFAFWGGDFYIFHKTMADASTNIWKLETDDGTVSIVVPNTGYRIVGAGVSTCAPVIII